jgi:hypothetical protein
MADWLKGVINKAEGLLDQVDDTAGENIAAFQQKVKTQVNKTLARVDGTPHDEHPHAAAAAAADDDDDDDDGETQPVEAAGADDDENDGDNDSGVDVTSAVPLVVEANAPIIDMTATSTALETKTPKSPASQHAPTPSPSSPPPSSSSSSLTSDGAAAVRIAELTEESSSLRQVWQETRAQLSRAKELHQKRDDVHKRKLAALAAQKDGERGALERELRAELVQAQRRLDDAEVKSARADAAHSDEAAAVAAATQAGDDAVQAAAVAAEQALTAAVARADDAEDERDAAAQACDELVDAHARALRSQRDEEATRIATAVRAAIARHDVLRVRDAAAAAAAGGGNGGGGGGGGGGGVDVSALAAAQRQLDAMKRQLDTERRERRFLQNDAAAAAQQVKDATTALASERAAADAAAATQAAYAEKARLTVHELQSRCDAGVVERRALQAKVNELAAAAATAATKAAATSAASSGSTSETDRELRSRLADSQARLKTMSTHLLDKQSRLDRLAAERAAWAVSADDARAARAAADTRVRALQAELADEDRVRALERGARLGGDGDLETGVGGGGAVARKKRAAATAALREKRAVTGRVADKTISLLDKFGINIGVTIRRNPVIRIFFAAYVVLLHIWVVYVFWHLTHHPAFEQHRNAGNMPYPSNAGDVPKLSGMGGR